MKGQDVKKSKKWLFLTCAGALVLLLGGRTAESMVHGSDALLGAQ